MIDIVADIDNPADQAEWAVGTAADIVAADIAAVGTEAAGTVAADTVAADIAAVVDFEAAGTVAADLRLDYFAVTAEHHLFSLDR
jgi:hypothetical protein